MKSRFPPADSGRTNRVSRRCARLLPPALAAALLAPAAGAAPASALPKYLPSHPPTRPELSSLQITAAGGEAEMFPEFSPRILHYAVRCGDPETLSVSAAADSGAATATLDGLSVPLPLEAREVSAEPGRAMVLEVTVDGERETYAVHCLDTDFPSGVRTVSRGPRRAGGLVLADPSYESETGERISHLAIFDDNGVPRFHRRIPGRAYNFRWHGNHRLYSYSRTLPPPEGADADEPPEVETVLLDENFSPVRRVEPVGMDGLDFHDFTLTEEGNSLFVIYRPVERDLSSFPDANGEYPWSTAEPTRDSVIQEVTPDGEVVFEWNSWERADGGGPTIRTSDCLTADFFPDDYAHLNSLFLSDGDLVASFRGCNQVLKIDRPSGRVLWQLGGSAPAIADGRLHYRIAGDPEPDGFCGQHTAIEQPPGTITLLDNGVRCPGDPREEAEGEIFQNHHTRVVEYRLTGEHAVFTREYRRLFPSPIAGAVQVLPDGGWLITTGFAGLRDDVAIEVDAAGREVWAMDLRVEAGRRPEIYRAYREFDLRIPLNPSP